MVRVALIWCLQENHLTKMKGGIVQRHQSKRVQESQWCFVPAKPSWVWSGVYPSAGKKLQWPHHWPSNGWLQSPVEAKNENETSKGCGADAQVHQCQREIDPKELITAWSEHRWNGTSLNTNIQSNTSIWSVIREFTPITHIYPSQSFLNCPSESRCFKERQKADCWGELFNRLP